MNWVHVSLRSAAIVLVLLAVVLSVGNYYQRNSAQVIDCVTHTDDRVRYCIEDRK